jgi:N-formylglutamate deformylase
MKPFKYIKKSGPILVSVPHSGIYLPNDLYDKMTPSGQMMEDTDWNVARMFSFVSQLDACLISANYSRYYIDLNRSSDGQGLYDASQTLVTGLCPTVSFSGEPLYLDGGEPNQGDIKSRIEKVWQPYHDTIAKALAEKVETHGYAILLDMHSIKSVVPKLFDGHLPHLNFGTNDGASTSADLIAALMDYVRENSQFQSVLNQRFKGGYITRHYGNPKGGVHAVQLEMAQKIYMDESSNADPELRFDTGKALSIQPFLKEMIEVVAGVHDHTGYPKV